MTLALELELLDLPTLRLHYRGKKYRLVHELGGQLTLMEVRR